MLTKSDTDIEVVSTYILGAGYDVAFLVPTETAMNKSIMDAHGSVQAFMRRTGLHDYADQPQGVKKQIQANIITAEDVVEKKVSLYRPKTKDGDPRIWIYGLTKFATAYNLIALIAIESELFIVNCSRPKDLQAALSHALPPPESKGSSVASELLSKMLTISKLGFIPSVTQGDTGVGMTLEHQLGISANSDKAPDYKGIELKASRVDDKRRQKNKKQLFSKTPYWAECPVGSAEDLVLSRGYIDSDGQQALRHTINGSKPNSRGLFLDIDYANDYLRQMFTDVSHADFKPEHDMTWVLEDLRSALRKKHKETFWVKALHNNNRTTECFHYVEVQHTANPFIDRFEALIETGLITMDYTLHLKPSGKARDHGYLFKLKSGSLSALFPEPTVYDLTK